METQANRSTSLVTPRSVGIKYGLLSALISIIFFLILVVLGQNAFANNWNWVSLMITIAIVFLAHKNFKDNGDGFMSYGQGVGIAFWIALVSVLINFLLTYSYVKFIDASAMELFYQAQSEELAERGMPRDRVEMAMSLTRILFWPLFIFFGLVFGLFVGLIVSIFTQKKNPETVF
jgi:TRAP-type C4-dicarboxylate transport system permease small subunit